VPRVLTTGVTITCGHSLPPAKPGKVQTVGVNRLTVSQSPVLVAAGIESKPVDRCATQQSNTTTPCSTVLKVTAGGASKLTVNGEAVLLDTRLAGETVGNPKGSLTVEAGGPDKLVAT
jgi:hypothetical protein